MRDRAFRRSAASKKKRQAKDRLMPWNVTVDNVQREPSKGDVAFKAKTPAVCSCACCGNPRHHYDGDGKYTMQERRANEAQKLDGNS